MRVRSKAEHQETARRLGRWLASKRAEAGLSQTDLMLRTGVHFTQISRLELGRIEQPSFRDLVLIGRELGVTPDDIAVQMGLLAPQRGESDDPRLRAMLRWWRNLSEAKREQVVSTLWQLFQTMYPSLNEPLSPLKA